MTPERERFLHKHIFVGEERSLCEVKVFNPRERRLPRHGCDHPFEPLVHLRRFDTVLNIDLAKRSCRRSHTHFNRCRPWKIRTRFPGNRIRRQQHLPRSRSIDSPRRLGSSLKKLCDRRHDVLLLVFCEFGKNWQSHRLVACSFGFWKISGLVLQICKRFL